MKKIYLLFTVVFLSQLDCKAQLLTQNSAVFTGVFYGDCVAADFNGDGKKEMLVTGALPGYDSFTALYELGPDGFVMNTANNFTPIMYSAVAVGDINNDGHLDFAITGTESINETQVFEIYYGNGNNTFSKVAIPSIVPTNYGSIGLADLNQDGHMDILVNGINDTDSVTKVYFQTGNTGVFEPSNINLLGTNFSATKIFDANSDGLPDILVTGYSTAYVPETKLYINQGNGQFTSHNSSLNSVYFSSIDTADINGDGHLDILLSGMSDTFEPILHAYLNDGAAHFAPIGSSFLGTYYGSSRFIDYNNDGLLDIFTMGSNADGDNKLALYKNNGDGTFSQDVTNAAPLNPLTMSRALCFDYDNDGDTDLFIMGYEDNDLAKSILYTNNSVQDCTPVFQYNADSNMITNVIFGTINNTSPFQSGTTPVYEDFTNISTPVIKGQTYPIAVKGPSSSFPSDVMVYIDFNQNGNFNDAGEGFYIGQLAPANPANANTLTANIAIPANAATGTTKMRIIKNTNVAALGNPAAPNTINDPCDTTLRAGQTEDYSIAIESAVVCQEPAEPVGSLGCVTFTYQGNTVTYTTVRGADRNIWLQQNLGTPAVATSSTDENSFGDLFQWGRWDDGHQLRTSSTVLSPAANNPSGIGAGNPNFFTSGPAWWNGNILTDEWTAATPAAATSTKGCDPCKALGNGWRLPTQTEWEEIAVKEVITSPGKAYDSNLKLTVGGNRDTSGNANYKGQRGYYWSSTTSSIGAKYFYFSSAIINPSAGGPRGQGSAVRCFKQGTNLGLHETAKARFTVYPNPTNTIVNIDTEQTDITVKIFNQLGQQIIVAKSKSIDLSSLAAGIYILKIDGENGETYSQKVVKQ